MELIFKILCGGLYFIGSCFNLTYKEVSIIICIYLWPIICTLSTIPLVVSSFKLLVNKTMLGLFCTIFSLGYTLMYITFSILVMKSYSISDSDFSFDRCVINLTEIANGLNMSYAELNICIYVVGFILIVSFNLLVAYLIKRFLLKKSLT